MYQNQHADHIVLQLWSNSGKSHNINFTNTNVQSSSVLGNGHFSEASFVQVVSCKGSCAWRSSARFSNSVFANNFLLFITHALSEFLYNCGSTIAIPDDGTVCVIFEECYINGIDIGKDDATKKFEGCVVITIPPTTIAGRMKLRILPTKDSDIFPQQSTILLSFFGFCS